MIKIDDIGIEIKKMFFTKLSPINPSELSEIIIVIIPKENIRNLYLK